jgi:hypothetical protein
MKRTIAGIVLLTILVMSGFQGCVIDDGDVPPGDARAKFLGDWKVNEDCSRGNYIATIKADAGNSSQVLIENFGNPGPGYDEAVGTVVGNSISVSVQNIGEGWTVSGNGTYNTNGSIAWSYTLVVSGYTENCTSVFTP